VSRTLARLSALLLALGLSSVAAAQAAIQQRFDPELWSAFAREPGAALEVVVLLEPLPEGVGLARARELSALREELVLSSLAESEFRVGHRYRHFPAFSGRARASALQVLAVHPGVVRVGLALEGVPALDSSVPFIRADRVHTQLGITGAGTTVAVVDTGVDSDHPDLVSSLVPGAMHFLSNGANVGPGAEDFGSGHGTHVAGIIASDGIVAGEGVAPGAGVLALQVINPATGTGFLTDWAAAIDHVVDVHAGYPHMVAINVSLQSTALFAGCPCDGANPTNQLLANAIQAAAQAGIVTVVATGNDTQCSLMASPACVSGAIGVVSVRETPTPDRISNIANLSPCADIAAPGVSIDSCGIGGGISTQGGTSQAAPHVTGTIALMAERRPGLSPTFFPGIIARTGALTTAACVTAFPLPKRVDAFAAVKALSGAWPHDDP
jgi:subtilisin family serine protease